MDLKKTLNKKSLTIVANFKMNQVTSQLISYVHKIDKTISSTKHKIVLCPSFISIWALNHLFSNISIKVGCQNMYYENEGSFTGEISANMLKDAGCEYVILGHSERKINFSESNYDINMKVKQALRYNFKIILCIGESLEDKNKNLTESIIKKQLTGYLKDIGVIKLKNINIAYEPVWAIGKNINIDIEYLNSITNLIKKCLNEIFYNYQENININILYGGSVSISNVNQIVSVENINGILVGKACLDVNNFISLIQKA